MLLVSQSVNAPGRFAQWLANFAATKGKHFTLLLALCEFFRSSDGVGKRKAFLPSRVVKKKNQKAVGIEWQAEQFCHECLHFLVMTNNTCKPTCGRHTTSVPIETLASFDCRMFCVWQGSFLMAPLKSSIFFIHKFQQSQQEMEGGC